jgi:hypothetical protein
MYGLQLTNSLDSCSGYVEGWKPDVRERPKRQQTKPKTCSVKTLYRHLIAWIGLVPIGILNGVIRQTTYGGVLPELAAHQISTATGILLFGLCIWWLNRKWPLASTAQAWLVGGTWLMLTIAFEFVFGHYVMGNSWNHLLSDYNLLKGRLWVFVLIWITLAPRVFCHAKRKDIPEPVKTHGKDLE